MILNTFSIKKFMNNVEAIFFGCVKERSLSIDILLFKIESFLKKEVKTFLLSISADIKQNCLLVAIFEVRVGSIVNE